ncbi:MAG: tetraacyldisaccharide 4'-kinase [Planctomycetota bacterium]
MSDPRGAGGRRFDAVMAGERRDLLAQLWRMAMWLPMLGYAAGNAARQAMFDLGVRRAARLPVPVISIGNLSAGGTGKTPATIWLARHLQALLPAGRLVGLLSRGYGNDERRLLADALPAVPHGVGASRATAGRELLAAHPDIACLLLDDGFSHRQLARDLDIVLVDATRPFAWGELLPRGLLREPPGALRRAHAVILTRADQASHEQLARLDARCRRSGVPVAHAEHAAADGQVETLRNRAVFAASGVGNPAAFRRTLEQLGAQVVGECRMPDHHAWSAADVARVNEQAAAAGNALVVTTSKDAVKLPAAGWHVVAVEFSLRESADAVALHERIALTVRARSAT